VPPVRTDYVKNSFTSQRLVDGKYTAAELVMATLPFPVQARLEGVNRPDLLPADGKGSTLFKRKTF
jgi:hypothetical protein